jgi:hypothetical protein
MTGLIRDIDCHCTYRSHMIGKGMRFLSLILAATAALWAEDYKPNLDHTVKGKQPLRYAVSVK